VRRQLVRVLHKRISCTERRGESPRRRLGILFQKLHKIAAEGNVFIFDKHEISVADKKVIFWYGSGSGSADPCLYLMDPDPDSDPDSAIFVIDPQDANKKLILKKFFCLSLSEGTFTSFFKDKESKKVTKQ